MTNDGFPNYMSNSQIKKRAAIAHNEAYEESKTRTKEKALHLDRYARWMARLNDEAGQS